MFAAPHSSESRSAKLTRPLLVSTGLLCCLIGCERAEAPLQVEVAVTAAKPHVGPIAEEITGDAVLAPLAQAALSAKINAPIRKIYVQRGAHVRAGQLLVSLEDKDLTGAALDSKGTFTAAEATYQETTKAQIPEQTQKAELDQALARANLDLNLSIVSSRKQLFEQGAVPGRDLDTAQASLVQAQAGYDMAVNHLQSIQRISRAASDRAAQGQLTSAQGRLQNAEAMLSYASLRSPISGVVTERPLFAGETAQVGTPIITVMDTSSLLAKIHLSQAVSQRMKVGDKAEVTVPGMDDAVAGAVSFISPSLDPGSTTVEIWVKLSNPEDRLKVGTPVHLAIIGQTVFDALQIPLEALVPGTEGGTGVMIVDPDGTAHMKPVQVGIRLPATVQVKRGITASDLVITSGAYGLHNGTKVKVDATDDAGKPPSGKPKAKQ